MENKLSYEDLQRRYTQLAEAMGADLSVASHEDCLQVAVILNKVKTAISMNVLKKLAPISLLVKVVKKMMLGCLNIL